MGNLFQKLKELFSSHKMEIVLIGIENSGKTTLLNQLTQGEPKVTAPTIGLNIKQVKKGNINMKVWDIGGQVQYRCEWNRYTKEADAIIFMVDASNVIPATPFRLFPERQIFSCALVACAPTKLFIC